MASWASVNAQVNRVDTKSPTAAPPKFIKATDAGQFKIQGTGKPFQPSGLARSEKPIDDTRAIIGPDDRIPMISRKYPWSTIGRIVGESTDGNAYTCTGTLIAENIVLTNSHCVINPETHQLSKRVAFMPNVINRELQDDNDTALAEKILYGTDFTNDAVTNQTNDWALIQLNKPIGQKYGYLGWKSLPSSTLIKNQKKFIFVGYSGDFPNPKKRGYDFLSAGPGWTASVQHGCSILRDEQNILFHDCDTTGGSSGGPIIAVINGQPYIVALNNAEIKRRDGTGVVNLGVKIDVLDRLSRGN
ncbi:peptidase S1 [Brasilonema bromeliae SPC951]|uniref:Peptidase S1 n=2 Tax=Bromeliae group (in: Brasilonema) TaxID=3398495 RepID=A0ABX1P5V5_9CYAN|nr:peptidase S1 [Brasilonema bromeliae SPC951]